MDRDKVKVHKHAKKEWHYPTILIEQAWSIKGLLYGTKHQIFLAGQCLYSGLLIGCGKKRGILRHFQGKLCGKKGPLCSKLCDFFKADLTLFY